MAVLILWSHALAALLLGALTLDRLRRPTRDWPKATLIVALAATALWALAVAGIDPRDVATRVAESGRTIAWLAFMFALVRRGRGDGYALASVYVAVGTIAALAAIVAVVETIPIDSHALAALTSARLLFRMMAAVSALVLVHHLSQTGSDRGGLRLVGLALALMWSLDLALATATYALDIWPAPLVAARGVAMAGFAALLTIGFHRSGDAALSLSRPLALRALGGVALVLYIGLVALLCNAVGLVGDGYARAAQTAIVCGAAAALLTLVSTPRLHAWTKVKLAKHLFSHRYDYRAEWQRFGGTLGQPGAGASPLAERIVKAIADLTDAPAGVLLTAEGAGAAWNWPDHPTAASTAPLLHYLAATQRIVAIDDSRGGHAPAEEAAVLPAAIVADAAAWIIVPLIHLDGIVGAILLARPPLDRSLDWEDLDLLRVAGRQAASYLAEDRAHTALADAARFEEFNRRFAFIIHDIKNLVSQLTLVARNAERHADNPEFRTDMIATLHESTTRMNTLLARLSQHNAGRDEAAVAVDVGALLRESARSRRPGRRIDCAIDGHVRATAQPSRLRQVIDHLVQNALEASADGAPVLLRAATEADRAVIEVIDRGVGMSAAFICHDLFRPFVSTKPDGFGIGAFEARQLVERMNGTLDVDSREGEGTRFRIMLPAAAALEAAA